MTLEAIPGLFVFVEALIRNRIVGSYILCEKFKRVVADAINTIVPVTVTAIKPIHPFDTDEGSLEVFGFMDLFTCLLHVPEANINKWAGIPEDVWHLGE
jgi:hypothetical protein